MIKKKILVSGYSSFLCRSFKKKNKFHLVDYKKSDSIKNKNFFLFIHFAVINKVSPSQKETINEIELIKKCLEISKKLKIKKFILMSTFQPNKNLNSYQFMKKQIEKKVLNSNLEIIIIRPTKIINKFELLIIKLLVATKINSFLNYKPSNPIKLDDFIYALSKIIINKKNYNSIIEVYSNFDCRLKEVTNFSKLDELLKVNLKKILIKI